jgi:hypothetical protein
VVAQLKSGLAWTLTFGRAKATPCRCIRIFPIGTLH